MEEYIEPTQEELDAEIEENRLRLLTKLYDDAPNATDNTDDGYAVLHLTSVIQDLAHRELCNHQCILMHPELFKMASEIETKLCELYQKIGSTVAFKKD